MLLSDDIFIQLGLDLHGFGYGQPSWDKPFLRLFCDNFVTKFDTFITDVDRRASNEFSDFILTFSTERTM
jgi:hypothetical protein